MGGLSVSGGLMCHEAYCVRGTSVLGGLLCPWEISEMGGLVCLSHCCSTLYSLAKNIGSVYKHKFGPHLSLLWSPQKVKNHVSTLV